MLFKLISNIVNKVNQPIKRILKKRISKKELTNPFLFSTYKKIFTINRINKRILEYFFILSCIDITSRFNKITRLTLF